jgi:hypothetical protein
MRVDGNIGGSIDGTGGADLAGISDQLAAARRTPRAAPGGHRDFRRFRQRLLHPRDAALSLFIVDMGAPGGFRQVFHRLNPERVTGAHASTRPS